MVACNPAYNPHYKEDILGSTIDESSNAVGLSAVRQCLKEQGFTEGLIRILGHLDGGLSHPERFWIIDNSGSMNTFDGQRLVSTSHRSEVKVCSCTRWEELRECIHYHINLVGLLRIPTRFELLNAVNNVTTFSVATSSSRNSIQYEIDQANRIMKNTHPQGFTPLVRKLLAVEHYYLQDQSKHHHHSEGTQQQQHNVSVIIATDGLPTDDNGYSSSFENEQFISAIKSLQRSVPSCWIVIRLCTDDPQVVSFYNSLDKHLEFPLEVLDDFICEAKEVYRHNPWLNYSLPLHRIRESGYRHHLLDLIDERPLTMGELKALCSLLFLFIGEDGNNAATTTLPDPEISWTDFTAQLQLLMQKEVTQWNPIQKRMLPWIDMRVLKRTYHSRFFGRGLLTIDGLWILLVISLIGALIARWIQMQE